MNNLKKNLKKNGFVLIKGFLSKEKNFLSLKKYLDHFLIKSLKNTNKNNIDKIITKHFNSGSNISAYINDYINLSPKLYKVLVSNKIISLISKINNSDKEDLIFNNPRFRIQIPNNDRISNLPWHQDSHYNTIKNTNSIVVWISIGKITKQMGPIIFKIGSHKWGELRKKTIKKSNGGIAHTINVKNSRIKNLKTASVPTTPGDVILIDMNCVHTSGKNKTIDKIKYSVQARYHVTKKFIN